MIKLNNTFLGFTDKLTPIQKSRVETCLNKLIRSEGIIYTNKDFALTRLQEGYILTIEENETHYSRKLDDYTKPRTSYHMELRGENGKFVSSYTIEKTLYNFGLYLQENNLINDENINNYIDLETARIEADLKVINDKELKEKQEKELQEQQKEEFKNWLNVEASKYNNVGKMTLSKEIWLGELNEYHESYVNPLLVLIDNINNPLCREALKNRLHSGNKASKKVFSCITGIILPSTDKGTMEILETIKAEDYTGMLGYKKRKEAGEVPQEIFYKLFTLPKVEFKECYGELVKKYGLDMFLCKEKNGYSISDIRSGIAITTGKTKEELFNSLKSTIERIGIEGLNKSLNNFVEKYGISPRYKAA